MLQNDQSRGMSRRSFIRNNALAATGYYIMPFRFSLSDKMVLRKWTRDLNVDIMVNQAGYVEKSAKFCVMPGNATQKFQVVNVVSGKVEHEGMLKPAANDLGKYLTGDFSALERSGRYYLKTDTARSYPFSISRQTYQPVFNLIVHYFSLQRCGASDTGYLSPCHLDDGIRMDNGKHQDVSGGWHDACDLRKWVDATIYGMIGLGKAYELYCNADISKQTNNAKFLSKAYELHSNTERTAILDELYWGNRYFLKMQEPDGYVMDYVGGDVKAHADSNRWTDNKIEKGKGAAIFVSPDEGKSTDKMLVFRGTDDRIIRTDAVEMPGQYNFIASEAMMSRFTKDKDPVYSQKCLDAAKKCFKWCVSSDKEPATENLSISLRASIEMYKTTREKFYMDHALEQAAKLLKLQAVGSQNEVGGFFYTSSVDHEPYKDIVKGSLAFVALCELVELIPSSDEAPVLKKAIAQYAYQYLSLLSSKNAFGIVPFGLYGQKDPGGNRKTGDYWYRYFMQPELEWWVGVNSNIASAAIGLVKAARILNDDRLRNIAQRQLDWIAGVNPFNSSTIISVGYNHPKQFLNDTEFHPGTPILPGAVMNGLGGNKEDQCVIGDGDWMISEYWTPMVAHTLWLLAELSVNP